MLLCILWKTQMRNSCTVFCTSFRMCTSQPAITLIPLLQLQWTRGTHSSQNLGASPRGARTKTPNLKSTASQSPACLVSKVGSREGCCKAHFIFCKPCRSQQVLEGSWHLMQPGSVAIIGSLAHGQSPASNADGQAMSTLSSNAGQ